MIQFETWVFAFGVVLTRVHLCWARSACAFIELVGPRSWVAASPEGNDAADLGEPADRTCRLTFVRGLLGRGARAQSGSRMRRCTGPGSRAGNVRSSVGVISDDEKHCRRSAFAAVRELTSSRVLRRKTRLPRQSRILSSSRRTVVAIRVVVEEFVGPAQGGELFSDVTARSCCSVIGVLFTGSPQMQPCAL